MRNRRNPALRAGLIAAGLAGLIAASTLPAAAQDYYNGGSRYNDQQPWNPDYHRDNGYSSQNREWQDRDNGQTFDVPFLGLRFHTYDQSRNHHVLSHNVIRHRLARQDYQNFSHWKLNNGFYRLRAEDRRGRDVRLVVNAYNGRIVDVQRRR